MKKIFVSFAVLFVLFSSGCTVPFLNIEIPFLPDIFPGMQVEEQRHDVISIEALQAIPFSTLRSARPHVCARWSRICRSPSTSL